MLKSVLENNKKDASTGQANPTISGSRTGTEITSVNGATAVGVQTKPNKLDDGSGEVETNETAADGQHSSLLIKNNKQGGAQDKDRQRVSTL